MRERDTLTAADGSADGVTEPSPRTAAVIRELQDIIDAREALEYELDGLLHTGQSESDEDYIPRPKASNAVCLAYLKFYVPDPLLQNA